MKLERTALVRTAGAAMLFAATVLTATASVASADGRDRGSTAQFQGAGKSTLEMPVPERSVQVATQTSVLAAPTDTVIGELTPGANEAGVQFGAPSSFGGSTAANAGATAMDDYKAGPGCMVQCITHGVAYARGVNSELRVWTDTPAQILIWVGSEDGSYTRFFSSEPGKKYFSALFDDLDPHTTYLAMATATDGEGYASQASGDFTTLTRNVELSFVLGDLESAPHGNDPFSWTAWANSKTEFGAPWSWPSAQDDGYLTDLSDLFVDENDQMLFGLQSFTLEDVDRFLGFSILVAQFNNAPCAWALPLDAYASGSDTCATWATADLGFPEWDLDARPQDATSWTEHTHHLIASGPGAGDMRFDVPVTMHVTYN